MDTHKKINTIIADDHFLVRQGVRLVLNDVPYIRIIQEFESGEEVINFLLHEKNSIDLLIIDINLKGIDGFEVIKELKKHKIDCKIIILSMHNDVRYIKKAVELQVDGYLLKDDYSEELNNALGKVIKNQFYYPTHMVEQAVQFIKNEPNEINLTPREQQILKHIIKGESSKMIAVNLNINQKTVDVHRSNLLKKFGCKNTAELVKKAIQN